MPASEPPYVRSGRRLKSTRTRTGKTQECVNEETGIPLPTYRTYEQGRSVPNALGLLILRTALGLDVNAYLDELRDETLTEETT
jgi:transcriptional regulator with XRE-family HTH domain